MTIAQLGGPPIVPKLPGTTVAPAATISFRSIEDELSEDEPAAAPRGRYGLRSQAPVAGPSRSAPDTVKEIKKDTRSRSAPRAKVKKAAVEVIVVDESDDESPAPNVKGKARESQKKPRTRPTYKSVEFIGDESGDESPQKSGVDLDIDSDNPHPISTLNPALLDSKVYCASSPQYWKGEIELPEGFLSYLGLVRDIGRAQQAVSIDLKMTKRRD